jgi:hypothetical protein
MTNDLHITHYRFHETTSRRVMRETLKAIKKGESIHKFKPFLDQPFNFKEKNKTPLHPKGGVTTIQNLNTGDTAYAYCGENDHFCRKTGREVAMSRI